MKSDALEESVLKHIKNPFPFRGMKEFKGKRPGGQGSNQVAMAD